MILLKNNINKIINNNTLSNKNDENKLNVSLSVRIPWIPNIGLVPSWYSNVIISLFFSLIIFLLLLLLALLLFLILLLLLSLDTVDKSFELALLANNELFILIVKPEFAFDSLTVELGNE